MPLQKAGSTESLDATFARVERKMRIIVWLTDCVGMPITRQCAGA